MAENLKIRTHTTGITIVAALVLFAGVGLLALSPDPQSPSGLPRVPVPHSGAAAAAAGQVLGPDYSADYSGAPCVPDPALLAQRKALPYQRGINLSGLEHSEDTVPGVSGTDYFPVQQADVQYFASLGFTAIRLPISWERVQRTINTKLNTPYVTQINSAISMAAQCNMLVILDLHNHGERLIGSTRYKVGTTQLPIAAVTDVWKKLAKQFGPLPNVWAFDTMNEPGSMPYSSGPTDGNYASTLSMMQRSALKAIRATGAQQWVMFETDEYSGLQNFVPYYGTDPKKWWKDPLDKTMVSGHYYFDADHTGADYGHWSQGLRDRLESDVLPIFTWGQKNDVPIYVGEFGVPSSVSGDGHIDAADIAGWHQDVETFMQLMDEYGVNATYWGGGQNLIDSNTIEPNGWTPYTDYTREWNLTKEIADHVSPDATPTVSPTPGISPGPDVSPTPAAGPSPTAVATPVVTSTPAVSPSPVVTPAPGTTGTPSPGST